MSYVLCLIVFIPHHRLPNGGFLRMTVFAEKSFNIFERRHGAGWVKGEVRADAADDGPYGPGAGGTQLAARTTESAGLVLVTEARVAGEIVAGMMLDDPSHGTIGQRPMFKNGVGGGEVGIQRAGEREQGASSVSLLPQKVAVEEGIEIKRGIAIFPVTREQ